MRSKFQVCLSDNTFNPKLDLSVYDWTVNRYSHNVIGGPKDAEITAVNVIGSKATLWEALESLRNPVVIRNLRFGAAPAWWGYVNEVMVRTPGISAGVSLDEMANKVYVIYSSVAAGSQVVGDRATTASASNALSIARYGTKELWYSTDGSTSARANALRDMLLATLKYPIPTYGEGGNSQITLKCKGWWDSLAWKNYAQTGTASTSTTQQIVDIVTASGQFLAGTRIINASGISSSQYRDGDSTALQEILSLLKSGTTNSRRLAARVTIDRILEVYEEPVSAVGSDYWITPDLQLRGTLQEPIDLWRCPVGVWTRLAGVIPSNVDVSLLAAGLPAFLEEVEYLPADETARWRTRNTKDHFDFVRVSET